MIVIKTSVDPNEGIIGLNGDFYLLDDMGEVMEFESKGEARDFLRCHGEDPDDAFIEYEDSNDIYLNIMLHSKTFNGGVNRYE